MSTVIKVEHVSKQYRLGLVGSGTMRDDLEGWWYRVRGKEDPTLKLGDVNDRSTAGDSNYVWALRDINFEVQQGEVLGIIGKNGAGKSTLLKLLSRVTAPTIGNIKVKGRIASLLEVGTGFHPELTGKENIFLNGAIMGMKKHEIARKLDEIVDFAGVERYLETPVKRYSSGMYVRLAFAVAAHLEPEILIVDEVLAVGDAEFQKKALGKMKEVASGEGRTILLVSHNMSSIESIAKRCVILNNGTITFSGDAKEGIREYFIKNLNNSKVEKYRDGASLALTSFDIVNIDNKSTSSYYCGDSLVGIFTLVAKKDIGNICFSIRLIDEIGQSIVVSDSRECTIGLKKDKPATFRVTLDKVAVAPGNYSIRFWVGVQDVETFIEINNAHEIEYSQRNEFGLQPKWSRDWGLYYINPIVEIAS